MFGRVGFGLSGVGLDPLAGRASSPRPCPEDLYSVVTGPVVMDRVDFGALDDPKSTQSCVIGPIRSGR